MIAPTLNKFPNSTTATVPEGNASAPLAVSDLSVAYQRTPVLDRLNFAIRPGQLTAIVGPNGAGKSTLLKAVLGLTPATGDVAFWGQPLPSVRRRVGYVPQRSNVDWDFPITVRQVVAMGISSRRGWFTRLSASAHQEALAALHRVGMADMAERQIGQLSGGQQQRVFLARALAQQADLYLMDEPMAGIDAATERVIFDLLAECRDQGRTVIAVHHDLDSVPLCFDDCLLLNRELIASGPVATTFTAENLRATFGGQLVIFRQ